ncbi:MAG TPA: CoA pyrophosphatase, partial [Bdellovibrionota bacterium]|nr:CoA pyrophosphatase [Bdellovibrionota bacterium]
MVWPQDQAQWSQLIQRSLALEMPYFARLPMPQLKGKRAAVLVTFGFREGCTSPEILLIRRSTGGHHSGQMAFPGGAIDPADGEPDGEGAEHAALREAQEEVGLDPAGVRLL